MGEELGLKETKEVKEFFVGLLDDLAKHKSDDGKIDTTEWLQTAMSNVPAGVKAMMGIDRVDEELKDLDEAEIREVAGYGVELMQKLAAIFLPDLAKS